MLDRSCSSLDELWSYQLNYILSDSGIFRFKSRWWSQCSWWPIFLQAIQDLICIWVFRYINGQAGYSHAFCCENARNYSWNWSIHWFVYWQILGTEADAIFSDILLTNILSPCLIWHVGRNAASIRLKTLKCLLISAKRPPLLKQCSKSVLNELFLQVVACLDDYDLEIRYVICSISTLNLMFLSRSASLSVVGTLIQRSELQLSLSPCLSKELLARLDDSSDQIRVDVCSVLADLYSRTDHNQVQLQRNIILCQS